MTTVLRCLLLVAMPLRASSMFTSVVPQRLSAMFSSAEPAIGAYSAALAAHPLETKVATAAALALVGDAIAQRAAAKDAPTPMTYDAKRGVSFVLFDAAYRGGFQHAAFPAIIELCRGDVLHGAADSLQLSGVLDQSMLAAIECTAVNQLVIVPVVYYPLFFAITGAVPAVANPRPSLSRRAVANPSRSLSPS